MVSEKLKIININEKKIVKTVLLIATLSKILQIISTNGELKTAMTRKDLMSMLPSCLSFSVLTLQNYKTRHIQSLSFLTNPWRISTLKYMNSAIKIVIRFTLCMSNFYTNIKSQRPFPRRKSRLRGSIGLFVHFIFLNVCFCLLQDITSLLGVDPRYFGCGGNW